MSKAADFLTPEFFAGIKAKVNLDHKQRQTEMDLRSTLPPVAAGTKVRFHSFSLNNKRIGIVVEAPGPSAKYDGRDAERYELVLEECTDRWEELCEAETVFADRGQLEVL